jgi:hypothetical protein
LAQNSREQPEILMYANESSILINQQHQIFTGNQGTIKERGQGEKDSSHTYVLSLYICLSIIAMQV